LEEYFVCDDYEWCRWDVMDNESLYKQWTVAQ
jgi:hypothetical protein